jgi:hypothetical protein
MNRPPLEVADLVRAAGRAFIERIRRGITWQHLKVLPAIARCRTAALGGHLDECIDCGYRPAISYNSCRDRHPQCANGVSRVSRFVFSRVLARSVRDPRAIHDARGAGPDRDASAASRTPLGLASGWGCRGRRLSRA